MKKEYIKPALTICLLALNDVLSASSDFSLPGQDDWWDY